MYYLTIQDIFLGLVGKWIDNEVCCVATANIVDHLPNVDASQTWHWYITQLQDLVEYFLILFFDGLLLKAQSMVSTLK